MSLTNYKAPLLLQNILLQMTKTKIQEISEREKDLKKNSNFSRWLPPLCCSAGVFIGDIGSRVPVQLFHENS